LSVIGALREILGTGALLGIQLSPIQPLMPAALLPFGGFLVFGLLAALMRCFFPTTRKKS
jgi:Na+-translocating ferredoxin:NAD+ oxidoreductase RnfE subunit